VGAGAQLEAGRFEEVLDRHPARHVAHHGTAGRPHTVGDEHPGAGGGGEVDATAEHRAVHAGRTDPGLVADGVAHEVEAHQPAQQRATGPDVDHHDVLGPRRGHGEAALAVGVDDAKAALGLERRPGRLADRLGVGQADEGR
jgi:hypothetical protein